MWGIVIGVLIFMLDCVYDGGIRINENIVIVYI